MISVVIPVFNSVESLPILLKEIHDYFSIKNMSYEVIFVNDGSHSKTYEMLSFLEEKNDEVKVIHLPQNGGQQKALYKGLLVANGDYALTIDDDLQHDICALESLLECARSGADLIFGIYESYGEKKSRELGSKIIGLFFKLKFRKLCGQRVSSLRLIHSSVYSKLSHDEKSFIYLSAELLPLSKKVGNVKVDRRNRRFGKSGYTLGKCVKIGIKLTLNYGLPPLFSKEEKEACSYETVVNSRRR